MKVKVKPDTKKCYKCGEEKFFTLDFFCKQKTLPFGLGTLCKSCKQEKENLLYEKKSLQNKGMYGGVLTPEQKKRRNIRQKERWSTDFEYRTRRLLSSYKNFDKTRSLTFDLDYEWIYENIVTKNCIYCGDNENIGADRKDNNIGHTKNNCIPCCSICNWTRVNNFTVEEMKLLGKTVAQIKMLRKINDSLN